MDQWVLYFALATLFVAAMIDELPDTDDTLRWATGSGVKIASALTGFFIGDLAFLSAVSGLFLAVLGWQMASYFLDLSVARERARVTESAKDLIASSAGMFAAGKDVRSVFNELSAKIPDPLGKDLSVMVSRYDLTKSSFEDMLENLSVRYKSDELRAMSDILRMGMTGGSRSVSKSLVRLNRAMRLQSRMLAERARQIAEPSMTALMVILILFAFLIMDATMLRSEFIVSFGSRLDMALGLGVMIGLILLVLKLSKRKSDV